MKCERTELTITHRCTLKCKLCGAYSPYYSNPKPHWSLSQLKLYTDKYFEIVDYVEKMTISGGEPLLHPDLGKLVEYLCTYGDRIGLLEFITNGTMIPKTDVIYAMQKFGKVKVIIDNYGPELSTEVPQIEKILDNYGIYYETRKYYGNNAYYDGWIDMSNVSKRTRDDAETNEIYNNCIFSKKFQRYLLVEGKLYLCATARRCDLLNLLTEDNDYINLLDDDLSLEQKKRKIESFFDRKHFEACMYCDGFNDKYQRHTPAEQIKQLDDGDKQ